MEVHIIRRDEEIKRVVVLDDKMRLCKPINSYLEYLQLRGLSENTIIGYSRDLKMFFEFLEQRNYSYGNVDIDTMLEFMKFLQVEIEHKGNIIVLPTEKKRAPATVNRILSSVHGFYKYMGLSGEIENPVIKDYLKRPTSMYKEFLYHVRKNQDTEKFILKVSKETKEYHIITEDEANIVYNSLNGKRDKLIFKILYQSGARIGEVLNLKITDIPIPDATSTVAVIYNIKSKGKQRNLYLPMSLVEEIDEYILEERGKVKTSHNYLFISLKEPYLGRRLSYQALYKAYKKIANRYGFEFTPHDYRHRFVSYLVESGMDMSVVQLIVGHAHITTTEIYTHISKQYIEKSLKQYWDKTELALREV